MVDDEPGVRLLLSEVIRRENYNVTTYERSDRAFTEALTKLPQIIFLDYLMEPWRGDEVIRRLNEESADIPVVLMSGMAEQELRDHLGDAEVFDVIEKPFSVEQIHQILEGLNVKI
ncbi:response regulator [Piscibacillus salipiscarius]|uniref:response regulator n=1 Tax=Piscibacillus salipiscarius TaxID=299480 RepID=UPI0006D11794|nr:response regulator [Piscibacillus salipiscarius]